MSEYRSGNDLVKVFLDTSPSLRLTPLVSRDINSRDYHKKDGVLWPIGSVVKILRPHLDFNKTAEVVGHQDGLNKILVKGVCGKYHSLSGGRCLELDL